jgi:hypothetical protein
MDCAQSVVTKFNAEDLESITIIRLERSGVFCVSDATTELDGSRMTSRELRPSFNI